MIPPISNPIPPIPRGDALASAVAEHQKLEVPQDVQAQIQRGLAASNIPHSSRTPHADFMADLKSGIMARINAG
jgi:hypothetical protein